VGLEGVGRRRRVLEGQGVGFEAAARGARIGRSGVL